MKRRTSVLRYLTRDFHYLFDASFYSAVRDYYSERQIEKKRCKAMVLREFGGPELLRYGQFQSQARAGEVVRLY